MGFILDRQGLNLYTEDMHATVQLGGRTIKLRESARALSVDPGYLSRLLSKRDLATVRLGLILQMRALFGFETVEEFLHAVMVRREASGRGSLGDSDGPGGVEAGSPDPLSSVA